MDQEIFGAQWFIKHESDSHRSRAPSARYLGRINRISEKR